jgi:hypothetical protein
MRVACLRLATSPTTRAQANKLRGSMGPPPPLPPVDPLPPVLLVDEPPPPLATVAVEDITVAWAEAIFVESTADMAVMVTVAGFGTVTGAVYTPDAEIIPTDELPPAIALTLQFTDVLELPVTAPVNIWVIPAVTFAIPGVTVTAMGAATVTVAMADLVVSAEDMALMVTAAGEGTVEGAVYTPAEEIIPTVELPPFTPLTLHVTVVFEVFVTAAVKVCMAPVCRVAVTGVTVTATGVADAGHLPLFALDGAVVVAEVALTTTSAVSARPASSVTVNRTVNEPVAGATTVAVDVLAFWIAFVAAPTLVHA